MDPAVIGGEMSEPMNPPSPPLPPPATSVDVSTPLHPAASRPSSLTTGEVAIMVNTEVVDTVGGVRLSGPGTPVGTESPGTSQMSPPPSYHDIPGTVPQGSNRGPPPSYEDAVDPNGKFL